MANSGTSPGRVNASPYGDREPLVSIAGSGPDPAFRQIETNWACSAFLGTSPHRLTDRAASSFFDPSANIEQWIDARNDAQWSSPADLVRIDPETK
jgi:hypothetical protein